MNLPGVSRAGRRISNLAWRIIFFNAAALVILVAGVLLVQSSRVGLVDERMTGITQEARIVASTLAEYSTDDKTRSVNADNAEPLLRQLIAPTQLRARLYATDGRLTIDTRNLLARNIVQTTELPPLDWWHRAGETLTRIYDGVMGVRPFSQLAPYFEAGSNGRVYREVGSALNGDAEGIERLNEQNKLVLSVAVPIERFRTVYGALLVSTEGGDIDDILREERATLIGISVVAMIVMLLSSLYLSGTIAQPIKLLAAAADRVRSGVAGREAIPSMAERGDEIGDLSNSLSAMTEALYNRIDAIESFAADVAHELKNPLTSLKSALEMLVRNQPDEARARLLAIIRNDIRRIDRLLTDISDASRLDAELSRETSEPIDLAHLLETIADVYKLTALPRNLHLAVSLALPERAKIMGRDERLGQIFRNLIDNAISFSPAGGTVTIRAQTIDGYARVLVEDEGPGIPAENLDSIFNRFFTERPVEHGFGRNSGLGLSIARQIAEGVGGTIRAENRTGADGGTIGAQFVVELPLASHDVQ